MSRRSGPFNLAIDEFLNGQWMRENLPAGLQDARRMNKDYREIVRELKRKFRLEGHGTWESYGQGAASFADVWCYRDTAEFRRPSHKPGDNHFTGLWILLCFRFPCFVMGEGPRCWSKKSSASYMPSFSQVDQLKTQGVRDLAARIEPFLVDRGLTRLRKRDVATALPPDIEIESNLIEGHPRIFDALFFWYD